MKDAEDEAFEAIERRQGGFQAKRAMAADKVQDETDMLTIAYLDGYERGKKAAQRPWVGLTDEEIRDCLGPEAVRIPSGWSRLTRAIEAKLKERNS